MRSPSIRNSSPFLRLALAAGALLLGLTVAGPLPAATPLDGIVAVVNDGVILRSELDQEMHLVRAQMQQRGIKAPPASELEHQVLEHMILSRIQVDRAKHDGIHINDQELNSALSRIASQNHLSLADFTAELKREGVPFDSLRHQLRDELMIQKVREKEVDGRINVTSEDVDLFLANHPNQNPTEYQVSHILLSLPENATAKQRKDLQKKADKLDAELRAGGNFTQAAVRYSDGQQALSGGKLGWRKAEDLPTLFAPLVPKMKVGEVSQVLTDSSGFHIIRLDDKRSGGKTDTVPEVHVRHILLAPNPIRDEAATKALAFKLYDEIKKGADFSKLAAKYSDDPGSKHQGGDLGWQADVSFVPTFRKVVDSLKVGQLSQPFQTRFGWHIAELLGKRQKDITEKMIRAQARQTIARRREEEAYETWVRRLRADSYVEIRLGKSGSDSSSADAS
jgi:Parvulin-like peptidyl-prolyl isomerase